MNESETKIVSRRINIKNEIPPVEDWGKWIENQKEIEKTKAVESVIGEVAIEFLMKGRPVKDVTLTVDAENACFVDEETIEFTFTITWEWYTDTRKEKEKCQTMN